MPCMSRKTQAHIVPYQSRHLLQEGIWLSSFTAKVGRGTEYGCDLVQGWLDAVYCCGHTGCVVWAQQLMAMSTGPHHAQYAKQWPTIWCT